MVQPTKTPPFITERLLMGRIESNQTNKVATMEIENSEYDQEIPQSQTTDNGRVAQSVTCLATDACLTADSGVAIRSRSGPILSWRLIMK